MLPQPCTRLYASLRCFVLAVCLHGVLAGPALAQFDDLMLVKYSDWSSGSGAAFQIFNPTNSAISLSNYRLEVEYNGSSGTVGPTAGYPSNTTTFMLGSTTLQPGDTLIIGNSDYCSSNCPGNCDQSLGSFFGVNGNDNIGLRNTTGAQPNWADMINPVGFNNIGGNNQSISVGGTPDGLYHHSLVRADSNMTRYTQNNGTSYQSWPTSPAGNQTGWRSYSSSSSSGCLSNLPPYTPELPAPGNLQIKNAACTNFLVGWDFVDGAGGYEVQLDTTKSFSSGAFQNNTAAGGDHLFTGLQSGQQYYFRVRAYNAALDSGFFALDSITLDSLTLDTTIQDATCGGDGAITVEVVSGGSAPYTFGLNGNQPQPQPNPHTFAGLDQGTYSVTAREANTGCETTLTGLNVGGPASPFQADLSVDSARCLASEGAIEVAISGGTAPYSYGLDGDPPQQQANPHTFSSLDTGTYDVTITDAAGCSRTYDDIAVEGPEQPLSAQATADSVRCGGDGTLTLSAEGGTAPYTYQLANAASQTAAGPATFDSLSADSYDVTVTDANDCATQLNVAVAASPSQPLAATATPSPATCNGAENGQIAVSASGGLPPYAYRLAEPKQTQADSTFAGLAEGSYRVRVIDDCADTTAPQAVSVGTMFDVQAAFTLAQQELQLPEARLQLTNNSTNAGTYSWGFGEGSAATSAEPTHTYTDAGTYTVELVAQNGACADTAEQTVRVIAPDLNMPSVFTPNGDQLNDRFRLAPGTFEEVTFAVYNRWGHQVHSADRVVWDGTSRSGTDLPEGTYIYHLEGTLSNGVAVDRKGSITLLR